jgi:flavin-dependent dehydrogenase
MRRGRASLKRRLSEYLVAVGIPPSDELELHGHRIPIRPRPGGMARGRVLLAGDAAGLADPITGEGISYSLLSGRLAGEAILEGGEEPTAVRRAYDARLRREILPELRLGRLLARPLYHAPRFRRALLRRAGREFCTAMLLVMSGQRSYRQLLSSPPNYLKLLRGSRAA